MKENENGENKIGNGLLWSLIVTSIAGGAIVMVFFFYKIAQHYSVSNSETNLNPEVTGIVGDFVGGVIGTLWAFAGVLLFYKALTLQKKELANQIKELKETKDIFRYQQFENTFFNLIKVQRDIVANSEAKEYSLTTVTKHKYEVNSNLQYFKRAKSEMKRIKKSLDHINYVHHWNGEEYEYRLSETQYSEEGDELFETAKIAFTNLVYEISEEDWNNYHKLGAGDKGELIYVIFFQKNHHIVGHYFRHLYHILKYISESEKKELSLVDDSEEENVKERFRYYTQFLQAQMSIPELFLTYYNCMCFQNLHDYTKTSRYNLLENLCIEDLLTENHFHLDGINLKRREFLKEAVINKI